MKSLNTDYKVKDLLWQQAFDLHLYKVLQLFVSFFPFSPVQMEVRVQSTLGTTSPLLSNVITIVVTPYTTEAPKIAVPGNHQGWSPGNAPLLAASGYGKTDFEGYVSLDGGYKFVGPNAGGGGNNSGFQVFSGTREKKEGGGRPSSQAFTGSGVTLGSLRGWFGGFDMLKGCEESKLGPALWAGRT